MCKDWSSKVSVMVSLLLVGLELIMGECQRVTKYLIIALFLLCTFLLLTIFFDVQLQWGCCLAKLLYFGVTFLVIRSFA